MCGRYTHLLTWAQLVALYRLTADLIPPNELGPRYNVAPTQKAAVVRERQGQQRELVMLLMAPIDHIQTPSSLPTAYDLQSRSSSHRQRNGDKCYEQNIHLLSRGACRGDMHLLHRPRILFGTFFCPFKNGTPRLDARLPHPSGLRSSRPKPTQGSRPRRSTAGSPCSDWASGQIHTLAARVCARRSHSRRHVQGTAGRSSQVI